MLENLETVLRGQFDLLQYAAFFGAFAIFAVMEAIYPRDLNSQERLRRWPANWILTVMTVALMAAAPVGLLAAADFAAREKWGLLNNVETTIEVALAASFLGRAFLSWFQHFLMHKVPLFWRIHRVHHLDTRLDTSSTVRFHPLEFVVTLPITLAGVVAFGPHALAILVYELLDASITIFTHANIRLPRWLDALLRLAIVTPDVHRVHHSSYQPETDSNFGAVLTIWDRLLGTYRSKAPDALAAQQNGLPEVRDWRTDSVAWLLISPVLNPGEAARVGDE